MPMINTYDLVIISGVALSNTIELRPNEVIVGLATPSNLPSIPLSFLVASNKTATLQSFYKDDLEFTRYGIASIQLYLDPSIFLQARRFQLRAGIAATPLTQSGVRAFSLITSEI